MKNLFLVAGLFCLQPNLHAAAIAPSVKNNTAPVSTNDRALAHFKENYGTVRQASWFTNQDKSMYCMFKQGDEVNRVFYDKKGYWEYTLVSYPPADLLSSVKELVLENFEGYNITYVNEIQSDKAEPVYVINIEDADNIKVILVSADEMEVKEELKKR